MQAGGTRLFRVRSGPQILRPEFNLDRKIPLHDTGKRHAKSEPHFTSYSAQLGSRSAVARDLLRGAADCVSSWSSTRSGMKAHVVVIAPVVAVVVIAIIVVIVMVPAVWLVPFAQPRILLRDPLRAKRRWYLCISGRGTTKCRG